jgi:hypothetical protein
LLERIDVVDPGMSVVDTHPLDLDDPSGLDVLYLMFVATIVGFVTVFQVRPNAGGLSLRRWTGLVVDFAVVASFVVNLVIGPLLHRPDLPLLES